MNRLLASHIPECPICGESGAYCIGSSLAVARHFIARAMWDLHRARQAFEALGRMELAEVTSTAIRQVDPVARAMTES